MVRESLQSTSCCDTEHHGSTLHIGDQRESAGAGVHVSWLSLDNSALRSHGQGRPAPCPSAVPGMILMTKTFSLVLQLLITLLSAHHSVNLTDSLCLTFKSITSHVPRGEVDHRPVLFSPPEPLLSCSWGSAHRL